MMGNNLALRIHVLACFGLPASWEMRSGLFSYRLQQICPPGWHWKEALL